MWSLGTSLRTDLRSRLAVSSRGWGAWNGGFQLAEFCDGPLGLRRRHWVCGANIGFFLEIRKMC